MTKEHRALLAGADAHRLADMTAKLLDLRLAAATTFRLKKYPYDSSSTDHQTFAALLTLALVRYARAHDKDGARDKFRIPQAWVDQLPDLKEAHHSFLLLRNKHIAHSVNDWEVCNPVAL